MTASPTVQVEACVTSLDEAVACASWGADRLELCRDLASGGLTPPVSLVREVGRAVSVPVFVMVRPEAGPFRARSGVTDVMLQQIRALKVAGASGLVFGLLGPNGGVDRPAVTALCEAAGPLEVTFHRAFDEVPDPDRDLDTLASLGVTRVLTGGGGGSAWEGRHALARYVRRARARPGILAAGGVRGDHVVALVRETGVREVHARASGIEGICAALGRDRRPDVPA